MHRSTFLLALLSVPIGLAGCVTSEGLPDDGIATADGTSGDTDDTDSSDTDDSMGSTDSDDSAGSDSDGTDTSDEEPEACNVPSPYTGGWDVGCCQAEVAPQNGWSPGQVGVNTIMPDWTMTDQFGDSVRLYDFCHDAIYFEYSAVW